MPNTESSKGPSKRAATIQTPVSDLLDGILFWFFVLGLAWSPFWLGAHAPIAWGINAFLFSTLVIIHELSVILLRRSHAVGLRQITTPAVLFFIVLIWIGLQNATWTPAVTHHPIWELAGSVLGQHLPASISVNRDLTELALIRLVTAASVFWLSLQLCRDPKRAYKLVQMISFICIAYAAYGLIAYVLMPGHTLWFENPSAKGYVTSTFYNKNSFGTYAGIGLVVTCAIALRYFRDEALKAGVPFKYRLASIIETSGKAGALKLGGVFIIAVALVATASRGAMFATLFGLFVFGLLTTQSKKQRNDQRITIVIGALLLAATFVAFGDELLGRVSELGVVDGTRLAISTITLGSILNSPLLGFGDGTFVDVFPMFRNLSVAIDGRWEMAHNSYVEAFQGLGVIAGSMLIASIVLLTFKCLNGTKTRQANLMLPRLATSISLLVGIHSLVDFSLQIQAVALTFMAILGTGVAQSMSSKISTVG